MNGAQGISTRQGRRARRLTMLLSALLGMSLLISLSGVATAVAAPTWDVKARWAGTNLQPGAIASPAPGDPGDGELILRVKNYGETASSGTVTVTDELPAGVTRIPPTEFDGFFGIGEGIGWTCEGTTTVTCSRSEAVLPFDLSAAPSPATSTGPGFGGAPGIAPLIFIRLSVAPGAAGQATNRVTVSGGGAAAAASDVDQVTIADTPAGFGVVPQSFQADVFDGQFPAGERVRQAGDHPFELRVNFDMNLESGEQESPIPGLISPFAHSAPDDRLRTVVQTLPVGLIGNPEATPKCSGRDYLGIGPAQYTSSACPPETQVGVMNLELNGGSNSTVNHGYGTLFSHATGTRVAVYNLEPPRGVPADFGFTSATITVTSIPARPAKGTRSRPAFRTSADLPVRQAEFTMWGVRADPAHDENRFAPAPCGWGYRGARLRARAVPRFGRC